MTESTHAGRLPLGVTAVMLPELDFDEQVALCAELGVTHYVYRPRVILEERRRQPYSNWGNHKFDLTPERLLKEGASLTKQLQAAGLIAYGTVPNITAASPEAEQKLNFEAAAAAGAGTVRLTPTPYPQEGLFDYAAYLDSAVRAYEQSIGWAKSFGVKPVVEMHAGNAAIGPGLAMNLVKHFSPGDIGLIVDLPNFAQEGGVRPNLCLSVVRDYVDHCHFGGYRRVSGGYDEHGFKRPGGEMCSLAECDEPVPLWVSLLAELGEVPLVIEDYTDGMAGALRLRRSVAEARRLREVGARV